MRSPLPLLTSLWISQYLGVGFFFVALAGILRQEGVSLERIALIQVLGVFWAAKFLWAPVLDRYAPPGGGHHRAWVLVLQPLIAVAILGLLPFDVVDDFGLVILVVGVVVLLSATQDIATDALAVRLLDPSQRGVANGLQTAGGFVGNVVGGGLTLIVYDVFGWAVAMLLLAVLTLAPLPLIVKFREQVPSGAQRPSLGSAFAALGGVLRRPGAARWSLAVVPLYYAGTAGAWGLLTPALVDVGWSLSRIGFVLNVSGSIFAVAGALATGALVRSRGRRRSMVATGIVSVASMVVAIPFVTGTTLGLGVGAVVIGVFVAGYAAVQTVVNTVSMDLCRDRTAATDYTMLSSLAFVTSSVVGGLVVAGAGTFGYQPMFIVCAVLVLSGVSVGAGCLAVRVGDRSSQAAPPPLPGPVAAAAPVARSAS